MEGPVPLLQRLEYVRAFIISDPCSCDAFLLSLVRQAFPKIE